ncbi:hypothetical protein IRY61_05420 [Candidatus Saccharibacteria bacterium]|nr:hypothetical protein [Candidatus Saccharibacteria bacterium]
MANGKLLIANVFICQIVKVGRAATVKEKVFGARITKDLQENCSKTKS